MDTLVSTNVKQRLEAIVGNVHYKTALKCTDYLHDSKHGWIVNTVTAAVKTFYSTSISRGRSTAQLDDVDLVSNGQSLSVRNFLEILSITDVAQAWIKTTCIEGLLFFSKAANHYRTTEAYRRNLNSLQFFGPAQGKDFYVEGSRGEGTMDTSPAVINGQIDVLAQLVRLKSAEEEDAEIVPPKPHVDAVRLASLEYVEGQSRRFRNKIATVQARWNNGETVPPANVATGLGGWSTLLVFYGDDIHWRLLLVMKPALDNQVVHIVYDPLYRLTRERSPGVFTTNGEADAERVMCTLRGMAALGYPDVFDASWPIILEGAIPGAQKDGWTCGWRAFLHFEKLVEYFSKPINSFLMLEDDAAQTVLSLFDVTRQATAEERQQMMKECNTQRAELRRLIKSTLALAYHLLDGHVREAAAKSTRLLNRF